MTQPSHTLELRGLLDIVWAIVLLQGGFLILSTIESLVTNATQGFALISVTVLTGTGAFLTLRAAHGLRRRKRWAKRLTLTGEWFVLTFGVVELVATQFLDPAGIDLVPLITGVVMPISVLVLLRRTKSLFAAEQSAEDQKPIVEMEVAA